MSFQDLLNRLKDEQAVSGEPLDQNVSTEDIAPTSIGTPANANTLLAKEPDKNLVAELKDTALTNSLGQLPDKKLAELGTINPDNLKTIGQEKLTSNIGDKPIDYSKENIVTDSVYDNPNLKADDVAPELDNNLGSDDSSPPVGKERIVDLLEKRLREGLISEADYKKEIEDAKSKDKWINILNAVQKGGAQIGSGLVGTGGLGMPKLEIPDLKDSNIAGDVLTQQKLKADRMNDLLSQYQKVKEAEKEKLAQSQVVGPNGEPTLYDEKTGRYVDAATHVPIDDTQNVRYESLKTRQGATIKDLTGATASRSSPVGVFETKINNAKIMRALATDPKNGSVLDLPDIQMRELATSTAGLLSTGGGTQISEKQISELTPSSLRGAFQSKLQWLQGNPRGADQQAWVKLLMGTAEREYNNAHQIQKEKQKEGIEAAAARNGWSDDKKEKMLTSTGYYKPIEPFNTIKDVGTVTMTKNGKNFSIPVSDVARAKAAGFTTI